MIDLSLKTDTWDIDYHEVKTDIEKPGKEITMEQIQALLDQLVPLHVLPIPSFSAKKVA